MRTAYIFDVDGTLTPSRKTAEPEFREFFLEFCKTHDVYLVTGSDRPKTVEQLGDEIMAAIQRSYNCSGCETWNSAGELIHASDWILPENVREWLQEQLDSSRFGHAFRAGKHFEQRQGMLNFSIVGRNANNEQRYFYNEYDEATGERERIAREFNRAFPELQATVGGITGIDIAPRGSDKSQILRDFGDEQLYFFGDDMESETGNDYSLMTSIVDGNRGVCYSINNWTETWDILKNISKRET